MIRLIQCLDSMWWTFKKEENSSKSHIDENWSSKNYVCEIRSTRKYFEKLVMVRRTQELCADTRFKRDLKGRSRGFQLVSNESKIHRLATIIHRNLLHKRNSQKICTYIHNLFFFWAKTFYKIYFFFHLSSTLTLDGQKFESEWMQQRYIW